MLEVNAVVAVMSVQPTSANRTVRQPAASLLPAAAALAVAPTLPVATGLAAAAIASHSHTPTDRRAARSIASARGSPGSAPIGRLLRIQDGLDVIQMIDRELSIAAPLTLGERRHRVGHDAQRLAGGITGEQSLGRALEVVHLVE